MTSPRARVNSTDRPDIPLIPSRPYMSRASRLRTIPQPKTVGLLGHEFVPLAPPTWRTIWDHLPRATCPMPLASACHVHA